MAVNPDKQANQSTQSTGYVSDQHKRFVETARARVEAAMEQHARAGAKPAAAKRIRNKARPARRR